MARAVLSYDAVVLTGGRSSRFGPSDKTLERVDGVPLWERTVHAVDDAAAVVIAGPREIPVSEFPANWLTWVREEPPGGGPLAGLAAALVHVESSTVLVLAGDLPFAAGLPQRVLAVLAANPDADAAVPSDEAGHLQTLAAAYRTSALRAALSEVGEPAGRSMRSLLDHLQFQTVEEQELPEGSLVDVDTVADLDAARALTVGSAATGQPEEGTDMLEDWTAALTAELGLTMEVDIDLVLDLAKDAAHAAGRPAAPVTTFLVGVAASRDGATPEAVGAAMDKARLLAARWPGAEDA